MKTHGKNNPQEDLEKILKKSSSQATDIFVFLKEKWRIFYVKCPALCPEFPKGFLQNVYYFMSLRVLKDVINIFLRIFLLRVTQGVNKSK